MGAPRPESATCGEQGGCTAGVLGLLQKPTGIRKSSFVLYSRVLPVHGKFIAPRSDYIRVGKIDGANLCSDVDLGGCLFVAWKPEVDWIATFLRVPHPTPGTRRACPGVVDLQDCNKSISR